LSEGQIKFTLARFFCQKAKSNLLWTDSLSGKANQIYFGHFLLSEEQIKFTLNRFFKRKGKSNLLFPFPESGIVPLGVLWDELFALARFLVLVVIINAISMF
jgi:hypothetical protein